jgi:hypothetical protein
VILALLGLALWKQGWLRVILSVCLIIWGAFAVNYDIKIAAPLLAIGTVLFVTAIMTLIGRMREQKREA